MIIRWAWKIPPGPSFFMQTRRTIRAVKVVMAVLKLKASFLHMCQVFAATIAYYAETALKKCATMPLIRSMLKWRFCTKIIQAKNTCMVKRRSAPTLTGISGAVSILGVCAVMACLKNKQFTKWRTRCF